MEENALEISHLSYRFSRSEQVLDNISLTVPNGSIYGFLGPNGAGKTTTLRLMLGLLRKQSGNITLLGKDFASHRVEILARIGSMIESPSIYGHLTAEENLALLQIVYRCPKERIHIVLDLVGLSGTAKKKAGQFSLGMKQRLSIAIALLHDPQLLILDEPTNGLDPNGIIEVRELLQKLNREQGTTIIISSHLLAEIEKLVTHTGIIAKGKMVFEGSLQDLKNLQQEAAAVTFLTSDPQRALQIFMGQQLVPQLHQQTVRIAAIKQPTIAQLNRQLVAAGIDVYGIQTDKNDLESIFINLINH